MAGARPAQIPPQATVRSEIARARIRVSGIVQGVGFRPFIWRLATARGLAGEVANDGAGVRIDVEGPRGAIAGLREAIERDRPPLAEIASIEIESLPPAGVEGFRIVPSGGGPITVEVSPDIATCGDCLREIFDPADRRRAYPFTNCTNCGPRYTIVSDLPYDRARTSMARFPMCDRCAAEYEDPRDRRFHAQPNACPACGPRAVFERGSERCEGEDAILAAADAIRGGAILAIKGLGGYHLACRASDPRATADLRRRKYREDKPFAVMARDIDGARALVEIAPEAEALLAGPRRPIVILPRRPDAPIAPAVAPDTDELGVMLPYTPLHHLLLAEIGEAIVLTSGNVSDEPIAYDDGDARERLAGLVDGFLLHDRAIVARCEDSVVRLFRGHPYPIRRSRGYAPGPIPVVRRSGEPILALGAELKSTFCLLRAGHAYPSPHIGDLENRLALEALQDGVDAYRRIFRVEPAAIAHDMHPEYLSTKLALAMPGGARRIAVQHHHAHIAGCLAEHGREGPAIGIAFDGLGMGDDGTLWGAEFLVADVAGYRRAGHFAYWPLPGGEKAIREPWRMAVAALHALGGRALVERACAGWDQPVDTVLAMIERGVNAPPISSAGRLFDAAAAILDVRRTVSYEGQAAILLEKLADPRAEGVWDVPFRTGRGGAFEVGIEAIVAGILDDRARGRPRTEIAGRFHTTLAAVVLAGAARIRDATGISLAVLSGGVFQNLLLLGLAADALTAEGFEVLVHEKLPANDGVIAFGQALVADRAVAGVASAAT
ncbi:MAG: carbamoyltransferase HypF [Planctomycetes bacterium]|nr:carbamoyltransferase HypF [Planctomycetota bacterium]